VSPLLHPAPRSPHPATPMAMLTVFVVDDHEVVRRGVTDLLNEADDLTVVKGHWFLPTGGQQTCPLVATSSAHWWPRNCPAWSRAWRSLVM
jgi:hypothetical protein